MYLFIGNNFPDELRATLVGWRQDLLVSHPGTLTVESMYRLAAELNRQIRNFFTREAQY